VQLGAQPQATRKFDHDRGIVTRRSHLAFASIALLAIAFSLGLKAVAPGISLSETIQVINFGAFLGFQTQDSAELRISSVEAEIVSFQERFAAAFYSSRTRDTSETDGSYSAFSFDERFEGGVYPQSSRQSPEMEKGTNALLPRRDGHAEQQARGSAPLPPLRPANLSKRQIRIADARDDSISPGLDPDLADDHTAIYDIAARTVYLPNGRRLEAHSGLGSLLDDPRYVREKNRGPTPPNVYDLTIREELFHGVRAIRLNPVSGSNMFGRDGMLAHTYMLGPNGQSNGCVSFRDYPTFLNAFLSGEINRLIVVERLAATPDAKTAWERLPDTIKGFFGRS
jgi:hypothetical protein